MKKLRNLIANNKDIVGVIGHILWLASNIVFPNLTSKEQYLAGHSIIFTITGKGLWEKKKGHNDTLNKK